MFFFLQPEGVDSFPSTARLRLVWVLIPNQMVIFKPTLLELEPKKIKEGKGEGKKKSFKKVHPIRDILRTRPGISIGPGCSRGAEEQV